MVVLMKKQDWIIRLEGIVNLLNSMQKSIILSL